MLIFNCTGGRTGKFFLETLLQTAASRMKLANYDMLHPGLLFDHVIFSTNVTTLDQLEQSIKKSERDEILALKTQHEYAEGWAELVPSFPKENMHVLPTIRDSVNTVKRLHSSGGEIDILVIGSLHLVGGLIGVAGLENQVFS